MAESTAPTDPSVLQTKVDATSVRFEKNMRAMADLVAEFHNEEEQNPAGWGEQGGRNHNTPRAD